MTKNHSPPAIIQASTGLNELSSGCTIVLLVQTNGFHFIASDKVFRLILVSHHALQHRLLFLEQHLVPFTTQWFSLKQAGVIKAKMISGSSFSDFVNQIKSILHQHNNHNNQKYKETKTKIMIFFSSVNVWTA